MSQESLAVPPTWSFGWRIRRFLFRVGATLFLTAAFILIAINQVDLVRNEKILDYPLLVALDGVDASVLSTELTATTVVRTGNPATMEELKRLAGRIALSQDGDVEIWSDVNTSFQAIYFQGPEPAGGTWTASARYLPGDATSPGRVEVSLKRDLHGRTDDLRHTLQQMKGRLQLSGGLPLKDVQLDVRLQARPGSTEEPQRLIESVMRLTGVETYSLSHDGGTWQASGYSPRIVDFEHIGGQRTNVTARVTKRGQDHWIELGSPVLH